MSGEASEMIGVGKYQPPETTDAFATVGKKAESFQEYVGERNIDLDKQRSADTLKRLLDKSNYNQHLKAFEGWLAMYQDLQTAGEIQLPQKPEAPAVPVAPATKVPLEQLEQLFKEDRPTVEAVDSAVAELAAHPDALNQVEQIAKEVDAAPDVQKQTLREKGQDILDDMPKVKELMDRLKEPAPVQPAAPIAPKPPTPAPTPGPIVS